MTEMEIANDALAVIRTARDKVQMLDRATKRVTSLHLALDALHRAEAVLREACEERIGFRLP